MGIEKDIDEISDLIDSYFDSIPVKTKVIYSKKNRELRLLRNLFSVSFDVLEYRYNHEYKKMYSEKEIENSFQRAVEKLIEYYKTIDG